MPDSGSDRRLIADEPCPSPDDLPETPAAILTELRRLRPLALAAECEEGDLGDRPPAEMSEDPTSG